MPKMLLHVCCAPDATHPLKMLSGDVEVAAFFYNPNIYPQDEYEKRLKELYILTKKFNVHVIEGKYDPETWYDAVKEFEDEPEGGKRCEVCYQLRLEETARVAAERKFDYFSTTLTISPHKKSDLINSIGEDAAKELNTSYIPSNFKKQDGFKISVELSQKYELYRQKYCGCVFSQKKS